MNAEVVIFTKPNCEYCTRAKVLLASKRVRTVQIILDEQVSYSDARQVMVDLSHGATTVPQIFINRKHIPGGFTGIYKLNHTGELDRLLVQAPPPEPFAEIAMFTKQSISVEVTDLDF